ncbi:MAG: M28 family peptidase [Flavobacteriales bacterium]|nr:M28 family peptidase [Flavobacteriales bacterium]MCB9449345.1 M28 family peptidase [Flavobacteriales bacterium]
MKKILVLGLPAVLLFGCQSDKPKPSLAEVFQNINADEASHAQGYEALKEATSVIGHRLTGSENGSHAETFAFDFLKKNGFEDVAFMPFEVEAWARKDINLHIQTSDSTWQPEVVSLAHSPVHSDVEAPLIFLGSGLRKDFENHAAEVKGKIVLANIGLEPADSSAKNLHRSEKTALAIEYGAAGIILYNRVPGHILLTGTASVTGSLNPIPAVNIAWEDGQKLKELFDKGILSSAHIRMNNTSQMIKARNVIATVKGSEKPDEVVLIGGHLDSWDLATGAIDNGIGSFTVLDIARLFKSANLHPARTVKFVMFMGEEQGLLGSNALIAQMKKDGTLDQVKCMVNLDMAGNPKGFTWGGREEMKAFVDSIGAIITGVDSSFADENKDGLGLHSDHAPFMMEGIPTLGVVNNMDPEIYKYYHSNKDDFNLVTKSDMDNGARFTAMLLYALADAKTLPAKRLTSDETRDFLIAQGLKEEMIVAKTWRWSE